MCAWKKGDHVTFQNGLLEQFNNYEIDETIYKEIPKEAPKEEILREESVWESIAIRKSSKVAIRQAARTSHFIKKFNRNTTIFSIAIIFFAIVQIIILILK